MIVIKRIFSTRYTHGITKIVSISEVILWISRRNQETRRHFSRTYFFIEVYLFRGDLWKISSKTEKEHIHNVISRDSRYWLIWDGNNKTQLYASRAHWNEIYKFYFHCLKFERELIKITGSAAFIAAHTRNTWYSNLRRPCNNCEYGRNWKSRKIEITRRLVKKKKEEKDGWINENVNALILRNVIFHFPPLLSKKPYFYSVPEIRFAQY